MSLPFQRFGALAAALLTGCGGTGDTVPATGSPPPAPTATTLTLPPTYRLVWSDEFDVPGLPDASRWVYDTGLNKAGWHNREKQYYGHARLENSEVRDGRLVITARREELRQAADWGGQRYTSARLITSGKASWTYGFFEIRARMPCGAGTWPAIWTLGHGNWPAAGELDILEHVGSAPTRVFSTVHTTSGSGGQGVGGGSQLPTACSAFNDYQMLWTPHRVTFAVNGRVHHVYENRGSGSAQWPFDAPQFLILNLAIGGDLGGAIDDAIFPVRFEVEHVRIYQAP
ncbi:glycoside hydrolase family 16 protein [Aquincola sp. S2]|uniref:Glycoside hydrolase family 16 protein n=1 Tax=Pseudaquabacterium terrae TaxID=2732868 RepID=A0ABX2EBQ4_9BURK|nr:glycoside hydrolase family 16 protein [Aquabacterium terrae]NRF65772.1 glycoside hydrolase family 16 protein [Aquabacterium terrae]